MASELGTMAVAAGFLAALLAAYAIADYVLERRRVLQQLRSMETYDLAPGDLRARELAAPARTRLVFPGARRLGGLARRVTPAGVVDRLRLELDYAGNPRGWDAERILIAKLVLAAALAAGGFAFGAASASPGMALVLVFGGAFVGWFGPEWVLRRRSEERQEEIATSLPDALDLLSITVEAGLGFDAAVQRVSREMGGPLGDELFRVVQEMRLGKSRADALRGLADRTNVDALKEFILAMIQAEVFGISVAQVLKVQAEELRTKRRQAVEEKAHKVPVKMIFPLILCILPATFVVLAGPAILRVIDVFRGF
jgi:tight adherence protein C